MKEVKKMAHPKISIIMGVYNCESTLEEALHSILNQTYQDFELIICEDGSSDNTLAITRKMEKEYPDKIKLIVNEKNRGLNYSLNRALELANGEYIARMDGDDLSHPERLEKQLNFLETNSEYAIVSSQIIYFDEDGEWGHSRPIPFPITEDLIKRTPFAHGPSMSLHEAFRVVDGYTVDKKLLRVEDYHLWMKMYKNGFKGANLLEPLYYMRNDQNAFMRRNLSNRLNETYVKFLIFRTFKLPIKNIVFIFRPILISLLPKRLYSLLHKKNLRIKA